MEIRSDIPLKGDEWGKAIEATVSEIRGANNWNAAINNGVSKIFDTQWALFKVCLAIGILYDSQIDEFPKAAEYDDDSGKSIPRSMFSSHASEMDYFFNAAILTSNTIDLSEADRLFLAFSEDITEEEMEGEDIGVIKHGVSEAALNFDKVGFLVKFANYGVTKINEQIDSNENTTMENLSQFLTESYKGETPELKKMHELEDLIDEDDID